ncbi:DNA damage-induced apoptosis suppressor protein isoform X2 [Neofelis nebulosa]|uniref:DNA damage-induced apoptosis suppressor protein isoform X2 n=1 Tax=Neofelis nebulosa TaxID=61452 RepID=UPI002729B225|nr:DNA damage-induced apoptosis suppressor protein isoform X2 [Neofelis nebulosa]XP_058543617.1 DNA damage-induced apoptosis suppressor protein isoform X2 [Neofelis nebulosa]XP_058543618.1 DNA damage-induced apoptosis suppressor protein isoform X2 [Neofelis nebulosa]
MNGGRRFLLASVLALQNSSFIYPSCQKCFSRLILVSKRSNCPKCGSTGKAENASYRYKLSLKVAESSKLFGITVFGSCLDAFFGLTATALHGYIQDHNEISETLDSDAIQNLLTKAVEICFIGQSFIFGVTNFGNQYGRVSDSNNFLKQRSDHKREVRALIACQIVLPDPGVAGFTVIDYFHQFLQLSYFRKLHDGSQAPNSHLLASEHTNSDLSSICGPDSSSGFFKSHGRDSFSRFWQASLELTYTLSHLTGDDFSASEQSKAIGTLHQNRKCISFSEATGSHSCHDAFQGSWSLVSYMDKKSTAQKLDEELVLQADQPSVVHSSHEIGIVDSNFFPLKMRELLESNNKKSFHSTVEIKNQYSQHELTCDQYLDLDNPPSLQKRSTCFTPSSLRLEEIASGSQDCDTEIWDDLPFSESLNEFLAVIESEIATTQTHASNRKCHLDNIDRLQADHVRLSVASQRTTGALHTPPVALRSSQATVKASCSKDNFFSNCEANSSPCVQKESQLNNTAEVVSINSNGSDISEYFPSNAYLSALFPSSKSLGTTVTLKSTRIPLHRAEISLKLTTSESDHSCLSSKYFNRCGEKSLSEMSEKLVALGSRRYNDVSDLCNLENKQHCRWPKNQDDSFTICRKLTYPSEALGCSPDTTTITLKEMPCRHINNNLTQNYSTGHEGSYDASADLFDDNAKEMDITTEIMKKSQHILLQWGKSLAESHHIESDFLMRSLPENSSQFSQKLSLQSMSATLCPRTCSSPPHCQSDAEYDFVDSQDFVPCSQSTPVAGFHQTRIHGMKGAFKNLPDLYLDLDGNYKKRKISSENDAQQATPSCPNNVRTPSQKSRSPVISGIPQPEVFNNSPFAECLETEDEWVPPTTKKVFPSEMLGFQALSLRKCSAACDSPDQKEPPRKKLKCVKRRIEKCLIKKELKNMFTAGVTKQKTLNTSSDWFCKESVLGLDSCSEVKCCLPFSKNWPPSVPETKSSWSPELFS